MALHGLRSKLVLLALLPAMIASLAAALGGYLSLRADQSVQQTSNLDEAAARARRALNDEIHRMHIHAAGIAVRVLLGDAILARDPAALRSVLGASYQAVRAVDPVVSVMEVTDASGRVLHRAHNPEVAGDDKSRLPDVAAALAGRALPGLERSPSSGQISGGAVMPLRRDGKVIGTVRVGFRLDGETARRLGQFSGAEILLFSGERFVAGTVDGLTAETLDPAIAAATRAGAGAQFEAPLHGRGVHRFALLPLADASGQAFGAVAIGSTVKPWEDARFSAMSSMVLIAVLVLLVVAVMAFIAGGRLAKPIAGMAAAMQRIAAGALDLTVPGLGRRDEVGEMATALESFRTRAIEHRAMEAEAEAGRALKERRAAEMEQSIAAFNTSVASVMRTMEASAGSLQQAAGAMASTASTAEKQAGSTEEGARRSCADLTAVAAATEELTASVGEITRQVTHADSVTREAATLASSADSQLRDLTAAAERIGAVVDLITNIAGQTNLLALNATIEAARAGDAGKGFAVVAGEVKNLATQTAKATGDIVAQIDSMRQATSGVVEAMRNIASTIGRVQEASSSISAAVEQQDTATRRISSSIQTVTESTQGAVAAMQALTAVATEAGKESGAVLDAAADMRTQSNRLKQEVQGFLDSLATDDEKRRAA
jgi:methyl-accepting chemotaxis protein